MTDDTWALPVIAALIYGSMAVWGSRRITAEAARRTARIALASGIIALALGSLAIVADAEAFMDSASAWVALPLAVLLVITVACCAYFPFLGVAFLFRKGFRKIGARIVCFAAMPLLLLAFLARSPFSSGS